MKPEFNEIGIEYEELMGRFANNASMANRFLKAFLNDQTFIQLQQHYTNHDQEELMKDIHTLKGLSGNLSMMQLYHITNTWLCDLRSNNLQTSEQSYQQCLKEYTNITQGLKEIFSE